MIPFTRPMRAAVLLVLASSTACSAVTALPDAERETGWGLCADGIDNDFDGRTDCEDEDCVGRCLESTEPRCRDGLDNDGDGVFDHAEPSCWPFAELVVGAVPENGDRTVRCSSRRGTALTVTGEDGFRHWRGEARFPPDPTGSSDQPVIELPPSDDCPDSPDRCAFVELVEAVTGGAQMDVDIGTYLDGSADRDAAFELVAAPYDAARSGLPPERIVEAVRVSLRRSRTDGTLELAYEAGGEREVEVLDDVEPGWLRLRLHTEQEEEPAERGGARARAVVRLTDQSGRLLAELGTGDSDLSWPTEWALDDSFLLWLESASAGVVYVDEVWIEREKFDPCGFSMPQLLPADPESGRGSRVLSVAADAPGRSYCAVGVTTAPTTVTAFYDPIRDRGWPPVAHPDPDPAEESRFASWRSLPSDDGVGPGLAWEVTEAGIDPPAAYLRALAMDWAGDVERFEGAALFSADPRTGGELVRITSTDCASWDVTPLPELVELGKDWRIENEPHEPGKNPVRQYTRDSGVPLAYDVDEDTGERRLAVALADQAGPRLQPREDKLGNYPRGAWAFVRWGSPDPRSVAEVERETVAACVDFEAEAASCLPTPYPNWRVSNSPPRVVDDKRPASVHQLIERGGERAYLVDAFEGIRMVIQHKADPQAGDERAPAFAHGARLAPTIIGPSRTPSTFDAAAVADPFLVLRRSPPPEDPRRDIRALLFYRGFETQVREGDDVVSVGGRTGVTPVRILAPR